MPHKDHWNKTFVAMGVVAVAVIGSWLLATYVHDLLGVGFGAVVGVYGLVKLRHHQRQYRKKMPKGSTDNES